MNFDATTPRYLVEQQLRQNKAEAETRRKRLASQRATIALAVGMVPFMAVGIWFTKTLYLGTHRIAGEVGVMLASGAKPFEAENGGNVVRIFIVGGVTQEEWARRRQLIGLGYEVELIPRRGQEVVYRVDSTLGSDVFTSFGALADELESLAIAAGSINE